MENLNPRWYAWILQEQRKYNMILAFGTIIIALVGILQIVKLYEVYVPNFVLTIIAFSLVLLIAFIVVTLIDKN